VPSPASFTQPGRVHLEPVRPPPACGLDRGDSDPAFI